MSSTLSIPYRAYRVSLGRPPTNKLILPWAGVEASYELKIPGFSGLRFQCPEPDPGNLLLSPAPGEQFDLTIQLTDQFFNYVSDTIYLLATSQNAEDLVLVQFNGLQYGIVDRCVRQGEGGGEEGG